MKKKRTEKKHHHDANAFGLSTPLAAVLVLLTMGIVAYWNSFGVPFVFDDLASIEMNSDVQLGSALTPSTLLSRAVLQATFAANHAINGENVWGYHFVNLLIH